MNSKLDFDYIQPQRHLVSTLIMPGPEKGNAGEPLTNIQLNNIIKQMKKDEFRSNVELKGKLSPSQFLEKVHLLDEYTQGIMVKLNGKPTIENRDYWLVYLNSLCCKLLSYSAYFLTKFDKDLKNDITDKVKTLFGKVGATLGKLIHALNEKLIHFLSVINTIVPQGDENVLSYFTTLVYDTMSLMLVDKCDEMQYVDNSVQLFNQIQIDLLKYLEFISEPSFELIVQFIQTAYTIGDYSALIPFLDTFSPNLGIEVVKLSTVKLIDLINYYKYMAFNLLALSLTFDDSKYNDQAEIYFRVLLNFPNLATQTYLNNQFGKNEEYEYDLGRDKSENLTVNLSQRQEVAWLFIINHLLRLTSLQQLSDPNYYMQQEFNFINKSLPASLSKDIHLSASRHNSAHSSVANLLQLVNNFQSSPKPLEFGFFNKLRSSSLGTIFNDGSYKEKSNLIVNFLRCFNPKNTISVANINDKFGGASDEDNVFRNSISEETIGKALYIKAIRRILLLLTSFIIKFLIEQTGVNNIPLSALKSITNVKSLLYEVLDNIDSFSYTVEDDIVTFHISDSINFDALHSVSQQLLIDKITNLLRYNASRLK